MITDFMADGLCAQTDPDAFFADQGGDVTAAKAVCRRCPVLDACRDYAIAATEPFGVWGGLTERERRAERHARGTRTAAQQRTHDKRAAARQLASTGTSKAQISRALHISGTTVNGYLADATRPAA